MLKLSKIVAALFICVGCFSIASAEIYTDPVSVKSIRVYQNWNVVFFEIEGSAGSGCQTMYRVNLYDTNGKDFYVMLMTAMTDDRDVSFNMKSGQSCSLWGSIVDDIVLH